MARCLSEATLTVNFDLRKQTRLTGKYDEGRRSLEEARLMAEEEEMQKLLQGQEKVAGDRDEKKIDLYDKDIGE